VILDVVLALVISLYLLIDRPRFRAQPGPDHRCPGGCRNGPRWTAVWRRAGVLVGLFELVPMFGAILSVVPGVFVALSMPLPTPVWAVLSFWPFSRSRTISWHLASEATQSVYTRSELCLRCWLGSNSLGCWATVRRTVGWYAVGCFSAPHNVLRRETASLKPALSDPAIPPNCSQVCTGRLNASRATDQLDGSLL